MVRKAVVPVTGNDRENKAAFPGGCGLFVHENRPRKLVQREWAKWAEKKRNGRHEEDSNSWTSNPCQSTIYQYPATTKHVHRSRLSSCKYV